MIDHRLRRHCDATCMSSGSLAASATCLISIVTSWNASATEQIRITLLRVYQLSSLVFTTSCTNEAQQDGDYRR